MSKGAALDKYKSFLLILLLAVLGGGVGVLAKVGLREVSPIQFTFWRFLSAMVLLLPIFLYRGHKLLLADFGKLFWVLLFGAGNILIFIYGIRLTTASTSQVVYTFSPLIAGVLSYVLFKEKLGARKVWGIIIGFVGTMLVVLLPALNHSTIQSGSIAGNLLILLAVCSHSLYSVLSKEKQKTYSPITITTYSAIFTFVLCLIFLPFESSQISWRIPTLAAILSILYVGLIGTGVYYLLYQYVIKNSSPVVATMVLYLQPIFTFVWAIGLLGERLSIGLILGMIIAFVGVFFAAIPKKTNLVSEIEKISG